MKAGRAFLIVMSAALFALLADQFTKQLVIVSLLPGTSRDVVPGLIAWTSIRNLRGAYGLFGDEPWFLIIMAVGVLAVFAYVFRELIARSTIAQFAYGIIVGGALGNIVDRLHYGFVVDFISLRPFPIFEVFNVADACVSVGAFLFIVASLSAKKATVDAEPHSQAASSGFVHSNGARNLASISGNDDSCAEAAAEPIRDLSR